MMGYGALCGAARRCRRMETLKSAVRGGGGKHCTPGIPPHTKSVLLA